jgi:simple sugar transport system permease protein
VIRALVRRLAAPLAAVSAGAAFGALLTALAGGDPVETARVAVQGLATPDGVGAVIFGTTTLIFTGLSVAFAYHAGLFNIGAEGQLLVGALASTLAALALDGFPAAVVIPAAVAAGAAGGALWAAVPGFLRARLGVHEVINTIMMNFIASGLTGYLVVHWFKEPGQMIPQTSPIPEAARIARLGDLPFPFSLVPASSPANASLLLALAACAAAWWILQRSPWGLEIRALGRSERAARTSGIDAGATWIGAMAVAGAFAGLAGANEVLGFRYRFLDNFAYGVGFLGIAVALLGGARIGGVIAAALLFGALNAGAVEIDLFTEIPREIVLVVQAGILLFVVAAEELVHRMTGRVHPGGGAP